VQYLQICIHLKSWPTRKSPNPFCCASRRRKDASLAHEASRQIHGRVQEVRLLFLIIYHHYDSSHLQVTGTIMQIFMCLTLLCPPRYSDRLPFRARSENAEIATELSLQPWRAFQPDGVIMFSDILTPLPVLGIEFDILKGKGPAISTPIRRWATERPKAAHALSTCRSHTMLIKAAWQSGPGLLLSCF
jgi:hypothetical protein